MTIQTWTDLERAALTDPWLHAAVMMVRQHLMTREQALITVALAQAKAIREMMDAEIRRLQYTTDRPAQLVTAVEAQRWNRG